MNHRPYNEASGHAVEDGHESAKKGNLWPSSIDAQKAQTAYHRRRENTKRNQGADLQEHAEEHICGVRLKVRNDDIGWFPRSGPEWLFNTEWHSKGTYRAKSGIEEERVYDRQHSEIRDPQDAGDSMRTPIRVTAVLGLIKCKNVSTAYGALLGSSPQRFGGLS
jgi:hypothetical protein